MSQAKTSNVVPLLFKKRRAVDSSIAVQYVGTTTELDIK
jgi:hypothetical protein